jgi:hypothetical protein
MLHQKECSTWIKNINELFSKNEGYFFSEDSSHKDWIIEWEKIESNSDRLNEKIKELSPLLINAYSNIELDFAKKFPESVKNEMFLKSLASLFEGNVNNIDWNLAEKQIKEVLKNFFIETDWKQFSKIEDIHIFSVAKEKNTNNVIGVAQFLITSDHDHGHIKIALYDGVNPLNNPELNKLLLSSIFKLIPKTARLYFHTRITNEKAINTHQEFGFTKFSGALPNWIDLEYKAENENCLQSIANSLQSL